jgi:hypothetical protein
MKGLSAKEYLSQVRRIDQRINNKLEQLYALRVVAENASATLSDTLIRLSPNIHSLEDVVAKMVDMEVEISGDIDRLVDLKHEIRFVIAQVADQELQTILELRYLGYKTWPEVAGAFVK